MTKKRYASVKWITLLIVLVAGDWAAIRSCLATTKGLSQIVTPDLQSEGDLSLSFQAQSERIANPYELQAELGLTKWAEVAVFKGLTRQPTALRHGTEFYSAGAIFALRRFCELVAAQSCRSSTIHRSWLLHGTSQDYRRRDARRFPKRSNRRLCLRF